jgi:hypothetical protein
LSEGTIIISEVAIIIIVVLDEINFRTLLVSDMCLVNWKFRYMCMKGAQVVRLRQEACFQKLHLKRFPMLILMNMFKNSSTLCLWLKCRNSIGVSGEQPKMVSAGQGGRVLEKSV